MRTYQDSFVQGFLVQNVHNGVAGIDNVKRVGRKYGSGGVQISERHGVPDIFFHFHFPLIGNVQHVIAQVNAKDFGSKVSCHVKRRSSDSATNV